MLLSKRHANSRDELSRFLDGFFSPATVGFWPANGPQGTVSFPKLDVSETDTAIQVSVELPGVKQEEIDIEVHADTLRISGEKKDERVVNEHNFHSVERRFGKFERMVALPAEVDGQNAEATFKDGVLMVSLPKVKPVSAQKITVKPAS